MSHRVHRCCVSVVTACVAATLATSCARRPERAALVFTGNMLGHIEPCGCSENESGGLPRRHSYLQRVAERFESVLILDNGDLIGGASPQQQTKLEFVVSGLGEMGYSAVNLGRRDMVFGVDLLRSLAAAVEFPLLSANLLPGDGDDADWPCKPFVVRELSVGGRNVRVAIVGVMSEQHAASVVNVAPQARVEPPTRVLRELVPTLEGQADFVILLAQMSDADATALARDVTGLDVIICGQGRHVPAEVERANPGPRIFDTGNMGRYVATLELALDANGKLAAKDFSFEIIDKAFPKSKPMVELIREYRSVLAEEDLLGQLAQHAGRPRGGEFIGNEACGACHVQDLALWRRSKHAHAYRTLARLGENKAFDPECVTCHVIGLGFQTGFVRWKQTPELGNVGCEACHGAGREHAEQPLKPYNKSSEAFCRTCHDPDHSTHFDYKRDWALIKHGMEKIVRKGPQP